MSKEIEGIIDRALQYKKVTKDDAQRIIKDIYWSFPELKEQMARLYSYFMPPMPKRVASMFKWVAKATYAKDRRVIYRYVYCDGSFLIGTDGVRLNYVPSDGREVGYYHPITGDKVQEDTRFPDWLRVIPPADEGKKIDCALSDLHVVEHYKTQRLVIDGIEFNRQCVLEALNGEESLNGYVSRGVLCLDLPGDCHAVIMSLRD
jgi:hypothetical protein